MYTNILVRLYMLEIKPVSKYQQTSIVIDISIKLKVLLS